VVQDLDFPVISDERRELGGGGLLGGQAGDGIDGLDGGLAGLAVRPTALDLERLAGVGEGKLLMVTTLIRRISARSCPMPLVRLCSGISPREGT
jgi:hypothetical protein